MTPAPFIAFGSAFGADPAADRGPRGSDQPESGIELDVRSEAGSASEPESTTGSEPEGAGQRGALEGEEAEGTPVHGAFLQPPRAAALRVEGGLAGALPTLLAGGSAGITADLDLGAHVVTHAGLAWALGATARWRPGDTLGVGLTVDESLYTVEDLAGIEALRAPFGNRVAATPALLGATTTSAGVDLGWTVGAEVGLVRTRATPDGDATRAFAPALDHLWAEVAASWPRRHGSLYVRFRAIVPVAAEFHPLGYLPWVAVGRSWGLR